MEAPCFDNFQLRPDSPLQVQLTDYLRAQISNGTLRNGIKLPASRLIAQELDVSRNTVIAALDQLKAEGFLQSRVGSGVYVDASLPIAAENIRGVSWSSATDLPKFSNYARAAQRQPPIRADSSLPFTMGVPDLKAFPLSVWSRLQRRHLDRPSLLGYDGYQGYLPLREALADYLRASRKVNCHAEQILICNGAQQALALVASVLLNKDDQVLVENPGYLRARQAFKSQGANLLAAAVGPTGLRVERLPEQSKARLLYVTPTHQYPLGGILPSTERLKLLDWAARTRTWIIEDDYDSEFHFFAKPIASLQGMAEQTPVLYTGSFSKTMFPALRLGYLVLPDALMDSFEMAKSHMAGESPLLHQAALADFIAEGHYARHMRKMRRNYQEKWEHMQQLFADNLENLDQNVSLIQESAGMHLVVQIEDIDDVLLTQQMVAAGFGSSPLSQYYLGPRKKAGLALGFANSNAAQRKQGIETLRSLLS